jgi:hypothetical protein
MASDLDTIAVVGCGVIGAGWATHFLAQGYRVVATDPGEAAEASLYDWVERCWPTVERLGLADGASKKNLSFTTDVGQAVRDAFFIQESGPERLDVKRPLIAAIEAAARPEAIIASSSSGLSISKIQAGALCMNVDSKNLIARRVAQELRDGDCVNLGIGLPTLVAAHLPPSIRVFFHSENGIMGMSPLPGEGYADQNLTDAAGRPVGALPGACAFALGILVRDHPRRPPRRHGVGRPGSGRAGPAGQLDGVGEDGAGYGRCDGSRLGQQPIWPGKQKRVNGRCSRACATCLKKRRTTRRCAARSR